MSKELNSNNINENDIEEFSSFWKETNTKTGYRRIRLERIIFEELDWLFREEIENPLLEELRVLSLELSRDYRMARARIQSKPDISPDVLESIQFALQKSIPFLRARLAEALDTKFTPNLRFILERTVLKEDELK